MPRITITVSLVDDDGGTISREGWSPLGYEDLGNQDLNSVRPSGSFSNSAERNLLERLRTSIDRSLLTFARQERRRWRPRSQGDNPTEVIDQHNNPDDHIFQTQYMGRFLPDPIPESLADLALRLIPVEVTEAQRMALITEQPMVEAQMFHQEPRKSKRPRPIKRLSRYKREPVI